MQSHPTPLAIHVSASPNHTGMLFRVLARRLEERGCPVAAAPRGEADLLLEIAPSLGAEAYEIADARRGATRVVGGGPRGLLYGVGKVLRTSRYREGRPVLNNWRGVSSPECQVRGIYLATHFGNYYEAAPLQEVIEYVEDLALWGANAVVVHFPTLQFDGFEDPDARANLDRLRALLSAGKSLGLDVGLVVCPNCGFRSAPSGILAERFPDDLGRRGCLGTLICPSEPDGRSYLVGLYDELFSIFADIGLDHILCWPYDEGGCGCDQCWPWGARGYLAISRAVERLVRERHPQARLVLSTWMYDTPPAGEWDALADELSRDPRWVNYVMADAHDDYPRFPLDVGLPSGVPLLGFPEISMHGISPWGGFGASPQPVRFQRLWSQVNGRLAGGFPYSEGIFEDVNKVIYAGFYWDGRRSAEESLREYISFEYSPDVVDDVLAAIRILEENHLRMWDGEQLAMRIGESALEARRLLERADTAIPERVKESWRWRVLYLRGVIDAELFLSGGRIQGEALKSAFDELTTVYHAESAWPGLRPLQLQ